MKCVLQVRRILLQTKRTQLDHNLFIKIPYHINHSISTIASKFINFRMEKQKFCWKRNIYNKIMWKYEELVPKSEPYLQWKWKADWERRWFGPCKRNQQRRIPRRRRRVTIRPRECLWRRYRPPIHRQSRSLRLHSCRLSWSYWRATWGFGEEGHWEGRRSSGESAASWSAGERRRGWGSGSGSSGGEVGRWRGRRKRKKRKKAEEWRSWRGMAMVASGWGRCAF